MIILLKLAAWANLADINCKKLLFLSICPQDISPGRYLLHLGIMILSLGISTKWCFCCILSYSYLHICSHSNYRGHFYSFLSCFEIYNFWSSIARSLKGENIQKGYILLTEKVKVPQPWLFNVSHIQPNVWSASEILFPVTLQLCLCCFLYVSHCFSHKILNFFVSYFQGIFVQVGDLGNLVLNCCEFF